MRKRNNLSHPRCLPKERTFIPPEPEEGDEIYCSGVIRLNITALIAWLNENPQPIVDIPVYTWESSSSKENSHVDAADITRPIIIAEIAPDYKDFVPNIPDCDWISRGYVCIDGYHRIEKAKRLGMETLPAVVLCMEQHIPFVYMGYDRYVDYWNNKLADRVEDARRWEGRTQRVALL